MWSNRNMGIEAATALGHQLWAYHEKQGPYSTDHNPSLPAQEWWRGIKDPTALPLCTLAILILDMVPHAAAPERMSSYMGWYQNEKRNRMLPTTLTGLVQVKQYYDAHKPPCAPYFPPEYTPCPMSILQLSAACAYPEHEMCPRFNVLLTLCRLMSRTFKTKQVRAIDMEATVPRKQPDDDVMLIDVTPPECGAQLLQTPLPGGNPIDEHDDFTDSFIPPHAVFEAQRQVHDKEFDRKKYAGAKDDVLAAEVWYDLAADIWADPIVSFSEHDALSMAEIGRGPEEFNPEELAESLAAHFGKS